MLQSDKDALVRALGRTVVGMMEDVMGLPDELRPHSTALNTLRTVDGHKWTISLDWGGFTGPATLTPTTVTPDVIRGPASSEKEA